MEILDQRWYAGLTGWELLGIAAAALFVLYVLKVMFIRGKQRESHLVPSRCDNCSWSGNVSKLARKCPRCNTPL